MTLLAPHLTAFLAERLPKERRASVHTCDTYAYAFKLLVVWAAERLRTTPSALTLEQLDAPCLLTFLEYLETDRKNSVRSRNARLAALKSFARFVEYRVPACVDQVRRILAIPAKKGDEGLVGYLTRPEMQALLDAPTQRAPSGLRDRAMLHLAYAGGLRVSELVGLCITDLTLQPTATVRVRGKGRRERVLPLWKTTTKVLREWLSVRQTTVTAARRGGLSRVAIWVQVAPHDEGDGSEVGRARRGVAGEWAFGGRFRDGQGVSGVNAALGSIAAVRAGLRRGGGSYGERGKAAIQGSVSSPAAGGREDATVPAGARRWGRAGVGRDCHRDRVGACPRGSRVRWVAAR